MMHMTLNKDTYTVPYRTERGMCPSPRVYAPPQVYNTHSSQCRKDCVEVRGLVLEFSAVAVTIRHSRKCWEEFRTWTI
jgi:hypothetical protein